MSICSSCSTNALKTIATTTQTVANDGALTFQTNDFLCGTAITHSAGSQSITITTPGIYFIHIVANGTLANTTAEFSIGLQNNGVDVVGASATATGSGILSCGTLLKVKPSCVMIDNTAVLTVVSTSADSVTYGYAEVDIVKVG